MPDRTGDRDDALPLCEGATRSENRSLRQQLAYMDENCQRLLEKVEQLQAGLLDAHVMLEKERVERREERNNQLTVVVAKHALMRKIRKHEESLQAEWQANIELKEKLRSMEEELGASKKVGCGRGQNVEDDELDERVCQLPTPVNTPIRPTSILKRSRSEDEDELLPSRARGKAKYAQRSQSGEVNLDQAACCRLRELHAQICEYLPGAEIVVQTMSFESHNRQVGELRSRPIKLNHRCFLRPSSTSPMETGSDSPGSKSHAVPKTVCRVLSDIDLGPAHKTYQLEKRGSAVGSPGMSVVDQLAAGESFPFVAKQHSESQVVSEA